MVFYKHFGFFDDVIILIFIIVPVTFLGLFFCLSSASFGIFSDNQGNGTVSKVLAIIM